MNKTRMLTIALLIAGSALLFANGTQENGTAAGATGETLTLTGKIKLQANDFPVLVTGTGEYELMYPRFYNDQFQVKDGETVTVTGITVPGPRWENDSEDKYLAVTKAVIAGKEYVVPQHQAGAGPMMGGRNQGPMMNGARGQGRQDGGRGGMRGNRW